MSSLKIISVDTIWAEIKKAYNPIFLEKLIEIPKAKVYAFGGIVTDPLLGKSWKDLDVRVILDILPDERDRAVSAVLEKYTDIIQRFTFTDGTVFRVKVLDGKDMIIDVGAANNFEKFRADFRASAIFVDLKTGEVVELGESCVNDFQNGIIRTLDEPNAQLEFEPRIMFRALKFAAKTGFSIDTELERILKQKKALIKDALNETLSHLQQYGKDSIAEYYLGNIFGGFKADAAVYVDLLYKYGFLKEMCLSLQQLCGEHKNVVVENNAEEFKKLTAFEDKLSLFLSAIAKSISTNPAACFEFLKKALALDTDRSDGNEFAVDPTKIVFVP